MGFVVVRDIFKQRLFPLLSGWSIPLLANDCMNKMEKRFIGLWFYFTLGLDSAFS